MNLQPITPSAEATCAPGNGIPAGGGQTCETHSPSVNTDSVPHPSNRSSPEGMSTEGAGTDQRTMPSLMDPPDRSGGRRGMPRSPYRATRNPSRRFRRRQRSGREDSLTSAKQMGVRMTNGQAGRSSDQVLNNALPPLLATTALKPADTRAPVMIPENFLHPDCVLHKERGSRDQKQKSSRLGFGMGNGNCIDNANGNEQTSPSAVGREETLQVLRKKLGSLGEFQHGNFGRAVEMLRSDVVAFLLEEQAAREGLVPNPNGWDCEPPPKPGVVTAVETRSVLTLRLGFVSVSYGVSLRWDEISGLVTRVTLRRACRDDFLKGAGSDGAVWSCHRSNPTRPVSGTSELHPKPQKAMTPDEVPALPLEEGAMKDGDGPADVSEHLAGDDADGPRWTLVPRPSLPSWLAQLALTWASPRNFLLSAVNSSSMVPSSYLSVSVLSVRRLHGGCDHCCRPATVGGIWSSILRSSYGLSKNDGGINEDLARPHSPGRRRRRRHTTRPYVRFVLATRITKFNSGNPAWSRRHHNSCLLPCPPEGLRWYAGREDLVVEVRNDWRSPASDKLDRSLQSGGGDPILASVTVPLSSVVIEEESEYEKNRNNGSDDCRRSFFKRRRSSVARDGAASTDITIPLRMRVCDAAPVGSISLRVSIKVPFSPEDEIIAAPDPVIEHIPNRLKDIRVDISVDGGGETDADGARVDESIELGPALETPSHSGPWWSLWQNDNHGDSKAIDQGSDKENGNRSPPLRENNVTINGNKHKQTKSWSSQRPNSKGASAPSVSAPADGADETENQVKENRRADVSGGSGWLSFLAKEVP